MYFAKDLILFVAVGRLKLLLDESRAMLVTAKLNDVVINILSSFSKGPWRLARAMTHLELVPLIGFAACSEFFE